MAVEFTLPESQNGECDPSWRKYGIILFPAELRHLFPGYKERFTFETGEGDVEAWVTAAASKETPVGDPDAGAYICSPRSSERDSASMSVLEWYRENDFLDPGDVLRVEPVVGSEKRSYRLSVVRSL